MSKSFHEYSVYMRGVTWSRDSHGLFDYESKNIQKTQWVTQEQARITRIDNNIQISELIKPEVAGAVD